MTVRPEDFDEFFTELNRVPPFPWQHRLTRQLFETGGRWPDLLDLPTASGKTSAVDIALFTLAAGLPVPRRIVFVVDRRTVVQQAAEHARTIREALLAPAAGSALARVRDGLLARTATADAEPLIVAELRGEIQQDRAWFRHPDAPVVLASTVDQVGSRLLFRGYGVADGMLPVHAGLLGNDALILLDEVHLARPFAALLRRIRSRYRPPAGEIPDRWQVVELSATPDDPGAERFGLDKKDLAHPVLGRRIAARKPTDLVTVSTPADPAKAMSAVVRRHHQEARRLISHPAVRSLGVVVNRVQAAVRLGRELTADPAIDATVLVLTGRMRGLDRDRVVAEVRRLVASGATATGKVIVVATQTIEAGADLDFDVMCTDCASIDSLIQRFGRVDRLGELSARVGVAEDRPVSVIVGTNRLTKDDDPVYGTALGATWAWLTRDGRTRIDLGIGSPDRPDPADRAPLLPVQPRGPVLTSGQLNRLVRTSPKPDADVEIDAYLHGLGRRPDQDVELVWRADLTEPMLDPPKESGPADESGLADLLTATPPTPGEAMSVPLSAVRPWLRADADAAEQAAELSDVESATPPQRGPARGRWRPVAVRRGGEVRVVRDPGELRPGDVVVVPAGYGGISLGSWDPLCTEPVTDIADEAALAVDRFRLRTALFGAGARAGAGPGSGDADPDFRVVVPTPALVEAAESTAVAALRIWLAAEVERPVHPIERPETWWERAGELAGRLRAANIRVVPGKHGPVYLIAPAGGIDTDPDASSAVGRTYPLHAHLDDVAGIAESWCAQLGLADELTADLVAAAGLHDIGKADSRFQLLLNEGRVSADGELLAKSAIPPGDRARNRRATAAAGYPPGLRHEVASVALLPPEVSALVRFLVGGHHGYGRPFFPPQIDPETTRIEYAGKRGPLAADDPYRQGSIGSSAPRDFAGSVARFGWFGAAWLEAILRLADHAGSRLAAQPEEPRP